MANPTQPKIRPHTYTGLEVEDDITTDRVRVGQTPARTGSSGALVVVLVLAIAGALGYYYLFDTPVTTTATPPVKTQDIVPTQPVPADPPAPAAQDPVPVTPVPAPVAPAPVTPAN